MSYNMAPDAPQPAESEQFRSWWVHDVKFGHALIVQAQELGVVADLQYPGATSQYNTDEGFFCERSLSSGPDAAN